MDLDIEKLALLARIKLSHSEKESLEKEFKAILDYVSELKKADISGIDDMEGNRTIDLQNIMRKDENSYEPGEFSAELMKEAPATKDGYVEVKHVFGK